MTESGRVPAIGSPTKNEALNFLASPHTYGAMYFVHTLLAGVPQLLRLTQGSSSGDFQGFAPDKVTGEMPALVACVENLIDLLRSGAEFRTRARYAKETITEVKKHQAWVTNRLSKAGINYLNLP